jgi:hypothetical protein
MVCIERAVNGLQALPDISVDVGLERNVIAQLVVPRLNNPTSPLSPDGAQSFESVSFVAEDVIRDGLVAQSTA